MTNQDLGLEFSSNLRGFLSISQKFTATPLTNLVQSNKHKNMESLKIKMSFTMDLRSVFCLILALPLCLKAQSYDELNHLESSGETKTYYSDGAKDQATSMTETCNNVIAFYKPLIDLDPSITILVLSPKDWEKFTTFPVYGMPHFANTQTLVVASEDNDFWKSFIPAVGQLPTELSDQIKNTYSDKNGNLTMRAFFDLLAIHELGHAFHFQGNLNMQRLWLGELFCNVFLHTYIAENEPHKLPALTVFPQMVISSGTDNLAFTSLKDIEEKYHEIGTKHPQNYGWYQCRWHSAAADIYDAGGVSTFVKLWKTLQENQANLDDEELTAELKKVHQSVADVMLKWDD
ncbi:hypothetical protein ACFOUP_00020 [Belliella kenyensis]|uniref:Uncharacterized protein n=1 Tax=Belliella kenyensis TaxID=1472724 RepID=A0ABV8EFG9_9BACT|nr:hypothetical protein [Belliella kenyensis]MCH7403504.1 hypothetical protein [Belliella kenyensis]MDN3604974.1 hypothetical protein [Belliella kenyensis]